MFAGVPGAGAEEGWYTTQLDFEIKQLAGSHIKAASIDVYKCFDQVVRPLVIALARRAGMPHTNRQHLRSLPKATCCVQPNRTNLRSTTQAPVLHSARLSFFHGPGCIAYATMDHADEGTYPDTTCLGRRPLSVGIQSRPCSASGHGYGPLPRLLPQHRGEDRRHKVLSHIYLPHHTQQDEADHLGPTKNQPESRHKFP